MELEEFATSEWWLKSSDASAAILEARIQIADQQGWDNAAWFSNPDTLEELHAILEHGADHLLVQLEDVVDEASQLRWLQDVLDFLQPAEGPGQADASQGEQAKPASGDDGPAAADSGDSADLPSAGDESGGASEGKQPARAGDEASGDGEALSAEAPATWDAQWGMFLRYQNGNYEYALSTVLLDGPGVDAPEGQPDGVWHPDQDTAVAARNEAAVWKNEVTEIFDQHGLEPAEVQKILHDPALEASLEAMEADLADLFDA